MLKAQELKALLRARGLRLTKRLGQHHLIDSHLIDAFLGRCRLSQEETVVEIGAGLGALTEALAPLCGRVIAVELDAGIFSLLAQRLAAYCNVTVVHEDILRFSWEGLSGVTVIGAIPYSITSPILVSLFERRLHIRQAALIVQEEVAHRLLASPGTKAYGRLSVLGRYGWEVARLLRVPRNSFFPQPAVDSTALLLKRRPQPLAPVKDEALFFDVVKAAFSQRRKTLLNCLSAEGRFGLSRPMARRLIEDQGLGTSVRGERLSLEQFAALADALAARLGPAAKK